MFEETNVIVKLLDQTIEQKLFKLGFIAEKMYATVVSTNKRSQAEVFKVYFSLKYLECNNYNVHFTLTSLCPTNVCRCISPLPLHWPAGT